MKIELDLTKDEMTILKYIATVAMDPYGDPLKDTYELGKDEPQDPYQALETLRQKIVALELEGS